MILRRDYISRLKLQRWSLARVVCSTLTLCSPLWCFVLDIAADHVQQASALPTELRCTLNEPRCTLTEPRCILTEARCTLTEPRCNKVFTARANRLVCFMKMIYIHQIQDAFFRLGLTYFKVWYVRERTQLFFLSETRKPADFLQMGG